MGCGGASPRAETGAHSAGMGVSPRHWASLLTFEARSSTPVAGLSGVSRMRGRKRPAMTRRSATRTVFRPPGEHKRSGGQERTRYGWRRGRPHQAGVVAFPASLATVCPVGAAGAMPCDMRMNHWRASDGRSTPRKRGLPGAAATRSADIHAFHGRLSCRWAPGSDDRSRTAAVGLIQPIHPPAQRHQPS